MHNTDEYDKELSDLIDSTHLKNKISNNGFLVFAKTKYEKLIEMEWHKCSGILNGIDTIVWTPEKDPALTKMYSAKNVSKDKIQNKKTLCDQFDLDINKTQNTKTLNFFYLYN